MPSVGDSMPSKMDKEGDIDSIGWSLNLVFFTDSKHFTKAVGVASKLNFFLV